MVLPKYRVAVLVHGCLWHGHQCKRFRWPVANASYWRNKIERNMARDAASIEALQNAGWTVKVVWDCQLQKNIDALLENLDRIKRRRTLFEGTEGFRKENFAPRLASGLPPITQAEIRTYIEQGRM